MRLTYDPELVEEAVMLAEGAMPREDVRAFRRERDRLYGIEPATASGPKEISGGGPSEG